MLGYIALYPASAVFYILVVLLVVLLARVSERLNHYLPLIVVVTIICLISAVRGPSVGVDTQAYVSAYEGVVPAYFEPGFQLFISLIKPLHSTCLFLGLISLCIYGPIFARLWELRGYCSISISTAVFMLLYFPATWNGLRSYIVTAIMFFASRYIEKRKYVRLFAAIALCCTIHTTSVVFALMLLAVPFWADGLSRNRRTLVTLGLIAAPLLVSIALSAMYSGGLFNRYFDTYSEVKGSSQLGLSWYLYFLIAALSIHYLYEERCMSYSYSTSKTVCLYVVIGITFLLISLFWFAGGRLSSYFLFYNVVLLSRAWLSSKQHRYGICFRFVMLVYCCYAFLQVLSTNGQSLLPYLIG